MNWKIRLSLVLAAVLIAAVLINLPSQADTDTAIAVKGDDDTSPAAQQSGKITEYPNGVSKIEPLNFAVSANVRDMPTVEPDGLVKRAAFVDTEKRREEQIEKEREKKGLPALSEEEKEINERNAERVRQIIPGAGAGDDNFLDPLVNKQANLAESPQAMPTPNLTFDGATQADNISQGVGALPPDVNGDVGINFYVSSVNLVYKIFNKNGTVAAGPIKTNALFAALPAGDPCRTLNDGDPIVMYDSLADRWHLSQFAVPGIDNPNLINYQCVALSVTGDPTGAYYVWSYAYPGNLFNDYPKVGVWTDAYHMTFNQFNNAGTSFRGLGILSQDRPKALAGDPTAGAVYINIGAIDPNSGGSLPGDIDGYVPPPAGLAEVIGEFRADEFGDPVDGIRFYKWIPNFTNAGNSTLTILPDLALASFDARQPNSRNNIEVLGAASNQYLDSIADRSMHRLAYRNFGTPASPVNSYVGNFAVNVSGVAPTSAATYQTGIRWFELRRASDSFSVFDQGTHNQTPGNGANGLNNWMGSIAQDGRGNIGLGFSQAGTGQRADIKIAGRTNNVAGSGTLNEGEALFFPSGGVQTSTSGRWGDYSAMNVDPVDDCTFWYTQEYYAATSNGGWSTRVGTFRFPGCVNSPKATINGTITFCEGGAPIDKASVDATGGFNRLTAANGTYSMIVSPGTYTVTASKRGGFTSSSQNVTVANGQTATVNICLTQIPILAGGAPTIISESCGTPNGAPDPGETLTVSLPIQNTGAVSTANLTASLLSGGGVVNLSYSQNYGALPPGGAATARNFDFKIDPSVACGSPITLTWQITDGAASYGTITKTYSTGARSSAVSFSENFDGVSAPALPSGWSNVRIAGATIDWVTSTTTPNSPPNSAFAVDSPTTAAAALVSPAFAIQRADAQISFRNSFNTEPDFDGTVLEYSTNNGASWTDVINGGGSFASGGYNRTLGGGPLGGRAAWSGDSGGYITTIVNLPASLAGQTVRFRWIMSSDESVAPPNGGERVDNVQIFTGSQCSTCAAGICRIQRRFNFDADNKSDLSVYRPSTGVWYFLNSQSGFSQSPPFGVATDKPVPADYDGDGKSDLAIYRPSNGTWYVLRSTAGFVVRQFGESGDVPQPADFDGDGRAELVVYRPSTGVWYVLNLANNQFVAQQFGTPGDKPAAADFDGDCKTDYVVYRPSNGIWYLLRSRDGFTGVQFGQLAEDRPIVGDYDGDGRADEAIFRPSTGVWYLLRSTAGFRAFVFGDLPGDQPAPADYDGDGRTDNAIYRPSTGVWFVQSSINGVTTGTQFGTPEDKPLPGVFVP